MVKKRAFFGESFATRSPKESKAVVLPAPLEKTVSYGAGTAKGPNAILDASSKLEMWDHEREIDLAALSVATLPTPRLKGSIEEALADIAVAVQPHFAAGRFVLGLGGEHSVTVGILRGLNRPEVGVIQLDAHADLRDTLGDTPYSHGCVMRRLVEMGHRCAAAGIRSLSRPEYDYIDATGYHIQYAHKIDPADASWIDRLIQGMPSEVYLTLDVDALDPACMPGTGTPEPGGLSVQQVIQCIETVAHRRRLIGADIVEVAPVPGSKVSEFTAAKLAAKILAAALAE